MSNNNNALRIRIIAPDGSSQELAPGVESVLLGSGSGAAVKMADPAVSSLHLLLKVEKNGGVTAIDLGSEAGTWIGDRSIQTPVALSNGDVLRVGNSRVRVFFDRPSQAPRVEERFGSASAHRSGAAPALRQAAEPARAAGAPAASASPARALALVRADGQLPVLKDPLPRDAVPTEASKALQVALLWGDTVLDVQEFASGVPVTIGDGHRDKFHVFSPMVGGHFTLAVADGSVLRINLPPRADVVVSTKQGRKSKEQLMAQGQLRTTSGGAQSMAVSLRDQVQVSLENVGFLLRFVRPAAAVNAAALRKSESDFLKIAGACVLGCAAVVLALVLTPKPEVRPIDGSIQTPAKYVKMLIQQEQKVRLAKKVQEGNGLPEGARAKDKEGKFGRPEAKQEEADPSRPGSPLVDERRREEDRRKVMSAGLLGALGDRTLASNIFGPGGMGSGINSALGGLKPGAGMGDARGVGGLGSRGTGTGGGGTGLGLGGLGTKGTGPGSGGSGSIDLSARGKETTRIIPGKTIVVGGLSKEVIARIIRQHQSEIKYCYEMELQKNPALFGKVAVLFIIDPAGSVSEANVSDTSLNNQNTEQCMLSRIRRWKFPEPQGGGIVTVTFPWVFKPAGSTEEG